MHASRNLLFSLLLFYCLTSVAIAQSTQQQASTDSSRQSKQTTDDQPKQPCPEAEAVKKNFQQLSAELQRLKSKVTELEKDRLATTLQEQMEREQDRAEKFQLHLIDIAEKEAPLLARIDQINQQLKPEALERNLVGVGSLHPEELREETKKSLMSERARILPQLELFRQDRYRTQASLTTTDAAILRIKQKLLEALR
jgi:TolA-binding protein